MGRKDRAGMQEGAEEMGGGRMTDSRCALTDGDRPAGLGEDAGFGLRDPNPGHLANPQP